MPVDTRCAAVLAGTALLGIGLDQATKAIVVATVEGKPPIPLIGHVLTVHVSRNSGAAFSFAPAETVLFTCLAVAMAVLIVTKVPRLRSAGPASFRAANSSGRRLPARWPCGGSAGRPVARNPGET